MGTLGAGSAQPEATAWTQETSRRYSGLQKPGQQQGQAGPDSHLGRVPPAVPAQHIQDSPRKAAHTAHLAGHWESICLAPEPLESHSPSNPDALLTQYTLFEVQSKLNSLSLPDPKFSPKGLSKMPQPRGPRRWAGPRCLVPGSLKGGTLLPREFPSPEVQQFQP